ncbi:MAG: hypothetical protein SF123_08795 [Chloroflexota bacterium]|nr:hypothetical protein [Chloroflexota bacterium]
MIGPQLNGNTPTTNGGHNTRRFERFAGLSYEVIVSKYEHAALGMKFHNWIRSHIKNTGPLNITPLSRGMQHSTIAPDLGIYIIGATESFASITARILRDLRNGSNVIWVVSPDEEAVIVYSRKGMKMLGMNDILEGGDVLPGFSLPVMDIIGSGR